MPVYMISHHPKHSTKGVKHSVTMCVTLVAIACTSVKLFVVVCSVPASALKSNQSSQLQLLILSLNLELNMQCLNMEKIQSAGCACLWREPCEPRPN